MAKKYLVIGKFEGKKIKEVVDASTKRQAKLKVGFKCGFGGYKMSDYMKSSKIKVKRKR